MRVVTDYGCPRDGGGEGSHGKPALRSKGSELIALQIL